MNQYSRDEILELLRLASRGLPSADIASRLGRSRNSVRVKAHQLGVSFQRGGLRGFLLVHHVAMDTRAAFERQAFARAVPVESYVGQLLHIIARDNLFDAILDDDTEHKADQQFDAA